jgi:hypothetical protein
MPTASVYYRERIDTAAEEGMSLPVIERDIIDHAVCSDEARAALWLYAWSIAPDPLSGTEGSRGGGGGAGRPPPPRA